MHRSSEGRRAANSKKYIDKTTVEEKKQLKNTKVKTKDERKYDFEIQFSDSYVRFQLEKG